MEWGWRAEDILLEMEMRGGGPMLRIETGRLEVIAVFSTCLE